MAPYKPKNSPYWHYDFWLGGHRHTGSCKTGSFEEAKVIEARRRTEIAQGSKPSSSTTIAVAFGTYYQRHARHRKSANDILIKISRIGERLGNDKLLSDLTNRDIAAYVTIRREEVSNASVNRELVLARAAFKYCADVLEVEIGKINWKSHMLDEPRERTRCLTDDEERLLLEAVREDFRPLIRFCLLTGCRVSSARTLTWANVKNGAVRLMVKSKTQGEFHELPITDLVAEILDCVREDHPLYVFTYRCFKGRSQRKQGDRYPFSAGGWRKEWGRALKLAGIEDFRFHDLRHTAGTRLLKEHQNIALVKKVLGHKDLSSTMRYAHVDMTDISKALSRKNPEKSLPIEQIIRKSQ